MAQEQRLKLSPQLLQSIQLMALPLTELKQKIQEELENNPALEIVSEQQPESLELYENPGRQEYEYFENSSDPGYSREAAEDASDSNRRFLEGVLSRPESLQDHLLRQLRLAVLDEEDLETGELLIQNLDANGFHIVSPEELLSGRDFKKAEKIIRLIQDFDPAGCCVRDFREALRVQAVKHHAVPEKALVFIDECFEPEEKCRIKDLSEKLGIDDEDVDEIIEFIRTLNPFPGSAFSPEQPRYVIPEVIVKIRDGQPLLVINDEEIPVLGISSEIELFKKDKNAENFFKPKINEARQFISAVQARRDTLLKVAKAVAEHQKAFFMKGPRALKPLVLRDIAEEVGVHEATVSRISTGKYVQTEWGIFELKYFFTNSISGSGSGGSQFSKEGVKELVKEIISGNKEGKKLSDQKISELLAARGINIARRTVAKYRKELDFSSSFDR
jgi:RNA polymerase sigma-54 factor